MPDIDDRQPTESMATRPVLAVMAVSIVAIVVALVLGFLDIIPLNLAFAVVFVGITAQTVVAWSSERQPASWTAPDDDDEDDDAPR